VAWNTANDAVLAEGKRVLIEDAGRFDGVKVVGVDEHVWRHTCRGDKYATVIIDLTGIREGTGPARLLDMVEGRSKQAFKTWLAERPQAWRDAVEVVAMDGFTGFKTGPPRSCPTPWPSWILFMWCGWPVTRRTCAVVGSSRPPVATVVARATRCTPRGGPCTPAPICSPTSRGTGWRLCSRPTPTSRSRRPGASTSAMITAYREPDRTRGRELMQQLIESDSHGVPKALTEVITLGRTLKKRAADVLAYFDCPPSNGPTEAINGRLEHLRGSALGFRNLTNYMTRSLLETGGFRPRLDRS
jgi:hypothetical protein